MMTFRELLTEVCFCWVPYGYNRSEVIKHKDGSYTVGKLKIESKRVQYKTNSWYINYETFLAFEKWYNATQEILEESDKYEHQATNL